MDLFEVLQQEHEAIWAFTEKLEADCIALMEENIFIAEQFQEAIVFIRTFADAEHHRKEEELLFHTMLQELGDSVVPVIRHGMLVEHDMGRLYVMQLEQAVQAYKMNPSAQNKLDILAHATAYIHLIRRHIQKENQAVYPFAKSALRAETLEKLNQQLKK